MAIPQEVIAEIKAKNEIESVISPYVNLRRAGRNLVGLCPFHNEKTPSFTVYPENGSFYCFGCGVGGDCITFTGLINNLDYIESVKLLAERSGVQIPESGYDRSVEILRRRILEINRETARFYHAFLFSPGGKWAMDYLTGRGLTLQTIRHFGIGCAPEGWDALFSHLRSKGYTQDEMLQADVIAKSQRGSFYDRFRNRVMFPVIDLRGNVIAFSGRMRPGDEKARGKYVNSSETLVYKKGQNLFGINFAKNYCADRAILVEGNMDCISLHQAGFQNTVALFGTAFTPAQAKLLSRYTKEIVIALDSDSAGQKAVLRALETLKDTGVPIRILAVPEGKDPDEYIRSHSADKFRALLDGAVTDIQYRLQDAQRGLDLSSDKGRLSFLQKAAALLAESDDAMSVDYYEGRLSDEYGVSKTALSEKVRQLKRQRIRQKQREEIREVIQPKVNRAAVNPEKYTNKRAAAAEETILSVLLSHPNLYDSVREKLTPQDFITQLNSRLFRLMKEQLEQGKCVELSTFGDVLSPAEMGYAVSLQNGVKAQQNPRTLLRDSTEVLKQCGLLKRMSDPEEDDEAWNRQMQEITETKKGEW